MKKDKWVLCFPEVEDENRDESDGLVYGVFVKHISSGGCLTVATVWHDDEQGVWNVCVARGLKSWFAYCRTSEGAKRKVPAMLEGLGHEV